MADNSKPRSDGANGVGAAHNYSIDYGEAERIFKAAKDARRERHLEVLAKRKVDREAKRKADRMLKQPL